MEHVCSCSLLPPFVEKCSKMLRNEINRTKLKEVSLLEHRRVRMVVAVFQK